MEILALLLTGLSIGFISSFFGIGGGSIIVPVLYSLYPQMNNTQVISTSLLTIFLLTLNNTYQYYRIKLTPNGSEIFNILISASLGAIAGSKITLMISTQQSKMFLGSLLLILFIKMILEKDKTKESSTVTKVKYYKAKMSLVCFIGALISSTTGLGGGAIFIPLFISLLKLPYKSLPPYSNMAMLVSTLFGFTPYLLQNKIITQLPSLIENSFIGRVNVLIALLLLVCSLLTTKTGVSLNTKISPQYKRISLGVLLFILGVKMLFV